MIGAISTIKPEEKKKKNPAEVKISPYVRKRRLGKKQKILIKQTVNALTTSVTQTEAAYMLGITPAALNKRLKSYPEVRRSIEFIQKQAVDYAKRRLRNYAPKASDRLVELIDSNSEDMQLKASVQVLDRVGVTKEDPKANIQVNILNKIDKDKNIYDID